MPPAMVNQFAARLPINGSDDIACWNGPCWTRRQNAFSRSSRSAGSLPAIRLALIAPIEVPITQSGSMPASCSA